MAAVQQDPNALQFISKPSSQVTIEAVTIDKGTIVHVDIDSLSEETKEILMYLV